MTKSKINILLLLLLTLLIVWQYTTFATNTETAILQAISKLRHQNLTPIITTLTNSVSVVYYAIIILVLMIFYYFKYHRIPWLLPLPLLINAVIFFVMKIMIHRPRPITMLITQYDFSFPSGHTLSSMIMVYVIILFGRAMFPNKKMTIIKLVGVIYVVAIIFTRLYLGVHYPSDILASLILGTLIIINSYTDLSKRI